MTNLMQRGRQWLADRLQEADRTTVTYRRGSHTLTLDAVASWWNREIHDAEEQTQVIRMRRYLFVTADLTIAGRAFEPRDGDRITETIAGVAETYEVMTNKKQPSSQGHDHSRIMTRVIAAQVSA